MLEFWQGIEQKVGLKINYRERVEAIERAGDGFLVRTTPAEYLANSVLLAIGRRGTPRKLGVAGEELPKVTYRLIEPEQYAGQHVLVVGGGDSALEAAASIAEACATSASSSPIAATPSAAPSQRTASAFLRRSVTAGSKVMLKSQVESIEPRVVALKADDHVRQVGNDSVIVSAGGILPTDFLRSVGIEIETKYGTA